MTLKLDWATHEAAKFAVEHWHYSRCMPAGKSVKVGVWEAGRYIGVVIFSQGACSTLGQPYGLGQTECAEMTRVALSKHTAPVTRIVSIALKMLRKQSPGLRLVVSFADPDQGHAGTIYKAGNWLYAGKSNSADEYIVLGERLHGRSARAMRSSAGVDLTLPTLQWLRKHKDIRARKVQGSSKHRFLMPLDNETRTRVGSDTGDTPPVQGGEGGSEPTPALQQS